MIVMIGKMVMAIIMIVMVKDLMLNIGIKKICVEKI